VIDLPARAVRALSASGRTGLPPAVVLGVTTNGLSFVRSLARRGVSVVMMDVAEQPGMRSRLGSALAMPDVCERPDAWLSALQRIAESAPVAPVLIATGDEHVLLVAAHRDALAARFRFRMPDKELAEMLCDKRRQWESLRAAGCAVPRSAFVDGDADVVAVAREAIGFPCVVKPCSSHRWLRRRTGVKLRVARDAAALRAAYRDATEGGEPAMLQELVPGPDSALYGVLAAYGADGHALATFTKRKLRQQPVGAGNGSLQVSTRNPELAALAERILRPLRYQGLVSLEFKWDERDRTYKLIEINPRGVSGNQLAVDSGVDLPWIHYRDVLGEPPASSDGYRCDVKYLHLGWHLAALAELRRDGAVSLARELRELRGTSSFALFDPRDPAPFAAYAWGALRRATHGRLRRRGAVTAFGAAALLLPGSS
jgi:D-aspartate ligase